MGVSNQERESPPAAKPVYPAKKRIDLTQGPIASKLARLAAPLVAGTILQTVYNLVDMFWVGKLGATAVAAVAIVFPTQWLLISIAMGVTIAGAAMVSQWSGAGDAKQVNFIAAQAVTLAAIVSTALAIFAYLVRIPLLWFLGASGDLYQPTLDYVSIIFWSVPFTFLFLAFSSVLRGAGDTVRPMYLAIASNVLNLVLDPLLIFGVGPFPALGVAGAAWATLIARAAVAVVGVGMLFSGRMVVTLTLRQMIPDWPTNRRLIQIGIPAGIDGAARSFSAVAIVAIITRFGPVATAAYGIGIRVMSLVWTMSGAIAQATATGVGQNLGADQPERSETVAWAGTGGAFVLVGLGGVLAVLFAPAIVGVFVQDPVVIEEGSRFLRISGLGFGFSGALMVIQGAFQGAGKTNYSMVLSLLNRWVLRIPLAIFLAWTLGLGAIGVWWSFLFADIAGFIIGAAWLKWGHWQQSLVERGDGVSQPQAPSATPAGSVPQSGHTTSG